MRFGVFLSHIILLFFADVKK
ncbi:hypothetical protein PMI13_00640, partial [Chryseobacterium populi]